MAVDGILFLWLLLLCIRLFGIPVIRAMRKRRFNETEQRAVVNTRNGLLCSLNEALTSL